MHGRTRTMLICFGALSVWYRLSFCKVNNPATLLIFALCSPILKAKKRRIKECHVPPPNTLLRPLRLVLSTLERHRLSQAEAARLSCTGRSVHVFRRCGNQHQLLSIHSAGVSQPLGEEGGA